MFLFNVYCLVASPNRWMKKGVKLGSSCQKKYLKIGFIDWACKQILNHTICQNWLWLGIQIFQKLLWKSKESKHFVNKNGSNNQKHILCILNEEKFLCIQGNTCFQYKKSSSYDRQPVMKTKVPWLFLVLPCSEVKNLVC